MPARERLYITETRRWPDIALVFLAGDHPLSPRWGTLCSLFCSFSFARTILQILSFRRETFVPHAKDIPRWLLISAFLSWQLSYSYPAIHGRRWRAFRGNRDPRANITAHGWRSSRLPRRFLRVSLAPKEIFAVEPFVRWHADKIPIDRPA